MKRLLLLVAGGLFAAKGFALGGRQYVEFQEGAGRFPLASGEKVAGIWIDSADFKGVARAATSLQEDIRRVTGIRPLVSVGTPSGMPVVIGTLGKSALIDSLVKAHKIDATEISGKWESSLTQVVRNPFPGVSQCLVIAGSDKRGTIYGIYDLSEQIGVSPWYWWADVPIRHHDALFIRPGRFVQGEPAVKYRGIFINDEAPGLSSWVYQHFGNYNHRFYEHVFELLLRLKANYLWPAMWNNCFNEDDPLNPQLADEYGIVMGTSHVEPMMRADKEWNRLGYTANQWNFDQHPNELTKFWTDGIERNKPYENIVTIAMRGKIDTPMSESANISLLERIVAAQREIIAKHINPDVTKVPQLWALYKEVQEYYEKGMRAPADVTLLWCDDNWGNIRRLPTEEEQNRSGGAGVYYHLDYVGGPRNYKWINTNPIPKIWEQMHLALERKADRIWIVNVGDLKPMEFPIDFFLSFAREPERWPKEKLGDFTVEWANREFGPRYARDIADIVSKYGKYNGRRKPELLEPGTYSLTNYNEADRIVTDYDALVARAEKIYAALPMESRDAFFQLVLFPVKASANLNALYVAVAKNRMYVAQGRLSANDWAAKTRALFEADAELTKQYHAMGNGRWNHMMDQTHIGYTNWQEPPRNNMPVVHDLEPSGEGGMGVAVEGSVSAWPGGSGLPVLPGFDSVNRQRHYLDVFNRGTQPFEFEARVSAPWIRLSATGGRVEKETRLWVDVDWSKAPAGVVSGAVIISRPNREEASVALSANKVVGKVKGFVESDGVVSISPEHFSRRMDAGGVRWEEIPDYGRVSSGMAPFPVTAASANPPQSACLEYGVYLFEGGEAKVIADLSPTLGFLPNHGLRIAFSFDGEAPQVVEVPAQYLSPQWEESVRDNNRRMVTTHALQSGGYHTLKVWMVDSGVVLQHLIVDRGGLKPSYLGPPESKRVR